MKLSNFDSDIRKKIIQTIDNLINYENVLLGIAIEKPIEFEKALKQIDINDLKESTKSPNSILYYTTYCYMREKKYDKEKLSKLVILAKMYS